MSALPPEVDGDRLTAAVDMLRRTGALEVQIRYSDDEVPTVWMAVARYKVNKDGHPVPHGARDTFEASGAPGPVTAVERLLDTLIDGGTCKHCDKPTGVTQDWAHDMPLANVVCWYIYDPETKKYMRSCEIDMTNIFQRFPDGH